MNHTRGIPALVPGGYVAPSRLDPEYIRRFLPNANNEGIDPVMAREAIGPVVAPPPPSSPVVAPPPPQSAPMGDNYGNILRAQQQASQQYLEQQAPLYQQMAKEQIGAIKSAEEEHNKQLALREQNRQRMLEYQNDYLSLKKRAEAAEEINPRSAVEGWRGIMAAVSVGLGAAASTLTGQPNTALDIINKAIDRDIDAQKSNAQNIKTAAEMQANAYDMAKDIYGSDESAYDAMRIYKKEQLLAKLQALETGMKPSETLLKLQGMQSDLAMDVAKQHQKLQDDREMRQLQWAQLGEQKRHNKAEEQSNLAGKMGGKNLPASDASRLGQLQSLRGILDSLEKEKQQKGTSATLNFFNNVSKFIPYSDAAQYEDVRRQSAMLFGTAIEGRGLTDQDAKIYMDMMPSSGDTDARAHNKIQYLQKLMENKTKEVLKAYSSAGYDVGGFDYVSKGDNTPYFPEKAVIDEQK